MRRKYHQRHDGETLKVEGRTHSIRCCDCGLVHHLKFRIAKGRISFTAWRDNRATAASRRAKRFKRLRSA